MVVSDVDGSNVVVASDVVNSDDAVASSEGVVIASVVVDSAELLVTVVGSSVVSNDPTKSPFMLIDSLASVFNSSIIYKLSIDYEKRIAKLEAETFGSISTVK